MNEVNDTVTVTRDVRAVKLVIEAVRGHLGDLIRGSKRVCGIDKNSIPGTTLNSSLS